MLADTFNFTKLRTYFWNFFTPFARQLVGRESVYFSVAVVFLDKMAWKLCQEPSLKPSIELWKFHQDGVSLILKASKRQVLWGIISLLATKDVERRPRKRSNRPANFNNFTTGCPVRSGKSRKQALGRRQFQRARFAVRIVRKLARDSTMIARHTSGTDWFYLRSRGRFRPSARVKFSQYERNDLVERRGRRTMSTWDVKRLTCRSPDLGGRPTRGRRSQF